MRMRCARGFTLLELVVTIAVLAVLTAVAFPSFESSFRTNRVATATNELLASLSLARSEAVRVNGTAGICASKDGSTCDDKWESGWLEWRDNNGNGSLDQGEDVLGYTQAKKKIQIRSETNKPLVFDGHGRLKANNQSPITGSGQHLYIKPDVCTEGMKNQRKVTVNASGQIKISKEECS